MGLFAGGWLSAQVKTTWLCCGSLKTQEKTLVCQPWTPQWLPRWTVAFGHTQPVEVPQPEHFSGTNTIDISFFCFFLVFFWGGVWFLFGLVLVFLVFSYGETSRHRNFKFSRPAQACCCLHFSCIFVNDCMWKGWARLHYIFQCRLRLLVPSQVPNVLQGKKLASETSWWTLEW